jgi:hypothetical protein
MRTALQIIAAIAITISVTWYILITPDAPRTETHPRPVVSSQFVNEIVEK